MVQGRLSSDLRSGLWFSTMETELDFFKEVAEY